MGEKEKEREKESERARDGRAPFIDSLFVFPGDGTFATLIPKWPFLSRRESLAKVLPVLFS